MPDARINRTTRRLRKFVVAPTRRAIDRVTDALHRGAPRRTLVLVNFSLWKEGFVRRYFRGVRLLFLPTGLRRAQFEARFRAAILASTQPEFLVWGADVPDFIEALAAEKQLPIRFAEDGFVRSLGLGAAKALPLSLCIDSRAPHFCAGRASDLEHLLGQHDFDADAALLQRADAALRLLLNSGISKYNQAQRLDNPSLYGPKTARRVLVLGQVEDDASIRHGCDRPLDNNDLVRIAAAENPGAQIIYKPHPDVMSGHRPARSSPRAVHHLCDLLTDSVPLAQALESIDHVYTISSLAGFEALLRGIRVTTLGCPFYAGWGLTDDRQPNPRRQRRLTLLQLFAATYLLYPRYFDARSGAERTFEHTVAALRAAQQRAPRAAWIGRLAGVAGRAAQAAARLLAPSGTSPSGSAAPGRNPLSLYVP